MEDLAHIPALHDHANGHWHDAAEPAPAPHTLFLEVVVAQHRANFDLWHQEDAARDPHSTDAVIAAVKRAIDRLNQQRNDLAEKVDQMLVEAAGEQYPGAPLHSETPGLIIDRLSILSLKLFHTAEQFSRPEVDEAHRQRNHQRFSLLTQQRNDLAGCLLEFWSDLQAGRRRFKLYRQLKMYNDPTLNPVLYRNRSQFADPGDK